MRPPSVRQRVVALCCANGTRPPHSMCKHKQMSGFAIQVGRAGVPCGNCGDRGDTVQPSSELLEAFDSLTGSHRVFRRLFWMFFNPLFTASSRNTTPKGFLLRQSFISFGTLLVFLWVRKKKNPIQLTLEMDQWGITALCDVTKFQQNPNETKKERLRVHLSLFFF